MLLIQAIRNNARFRDKVAQTPANTAEFWTAMC